MSIESIGQAGDSCSNLLSVLDALLLQVIDTSLLSQDLRVLAIDPPPHRENDNTRKTQAGQNFNRGLRHSMNVAPER